MTYDPRKHHRRSIRLPGYDYTQPGAYFVTFVAHDRECLFGEVVDGVMWLNAFGEIVRDEWFRTAVVRPYVMLDPDEFVVMPNHVHGIIWIVRSGDGDHGDDGGGVFAGAHGGDASVGAHLVGAHGGDAPVGAHLVGAHGGDAPVGAHLVGAHGGDAPVGAHLLVGAHGGDAPVGAHLLVGAHGGDAPVGAHLLVGAQRRCAPTNTNTNANAITDAVNITEHRQCRGATPTNVIPGSLGAIVRAIKSATTKRINALRGTLAAPVWGRNYYEHIIRYETSLNRIRRYIAANPSRWAEDRDHPCHPPRRRANAGRGHRSVGVHR
jgi:putative transposase